MSEATLPATAPAFGAYEPPRAARRLESIDMLRGIVMVVMLLDHTRDFVHIAALGDPTNLTTTSWALFLTRWVTHFCAPAFVFLSGVSIQLQEQRGKPKSVLSRFLITRGLWLIFLEIVVIRALAAWTLDPVAVIQVIGAIGFSMVVMAGAIRLPWKVVGAVGATIVLGHNALDRMHVNVWHGPPAPVPGVADQLMTFVHVQGVITPFGFPAPVIFVMYPVLAWIGVMMLGYAAGQLWTLDSPRRRTLLLQLGGAVTAGFIALRATNVYGDASHWAVQRTAVFTALSFINTSKYPPSLLYLMMTLGPALLFMGLMEGRAVPDRLRAFSVYGKVPLFFYLLQWLYAHATGLVLDLAFGRSTRLTLGSFLDTSAAPASPPLGFRLWVVYLVWITGALLLYPLCRWYAGVKARRTDWWLSYL
ncbi:MAG: hypothetical protein JWO05_290 [Gemmatimonadetes bacterium]|nr:hypothetical protein [Gemmatimonadota bacterium]